MSLKLLPRAGHVLVKPITPKPASCGSIVLADVYHEPETSGEIIAVPESSTCPECGASTERELHEGDIIVFPPSAGDELEWMGERYLLIAESTVLGVMVEA